MITKELADYLIISGKKQHVQVLTSFHHMCPQ